MGEHVGGAYLKAAIHEVVRPYRHPVGLCGHLLDAHALAMAGTRVRTGCCEDKGRNDTQSASE